MAGPDRFVPAAGYCMLVALALLATEPDAWAQISPGRLSRPHRSLDSSTNCLDCHQPGTGVSSSKCLSCHVLVAQRIEASAGLHAKPGYADCAACHMDHSGREFELIWWGDAGQESFDHDLSGYVLEGAHATVECRQCHQAANIVLPDRLRVRGKDLGRTFLGLDTSCTNCHADEHRGQFEGRDCTSCHATATWVPASGFEHDATGFALVGAHERIDCASCHTEIRSSPVAPGTRNRPRGAVYRLYSRGGVAGCASTSCHVDPHAGQFRNTECLSCHTNLSWTPASRFDHSRSRFPLTGQHRFLECAKCHDRGLGATSTGQPVVRYRGLEFEQCTSCHVDSHEGRLGPSCSTCHSTQGWSRSASAFDHGLTHYPLRGKHAGLECEACHTPGQPRRIEHFDRCSDCHSDAHYGQLSEESAAAGCERCHNVGGFRPVAFGIEDHDGTRYPLDSSHRRVDCEQCHRPFPVAVLAAQNLLSAGQDVLIHDRGLSTVQLRFGTLDCASCHDDPHGGQVDRIVASTGCETCHVSDRWNGVSFDHTSTSFRLEGIHASTACVKCHSRVEGDLPNADTATRIRFTGVGTECRACHDDQHQGQFDRPEPATSCAQCHTPEVWKPSSFDHGRDSSFPLEGAHGRVACGACHPRTGEGPGSFVRYRPLPSDCQDCHGATLARNSSWL